MARPLALAFALALSPAVFAQSFVNWENPHVHPIDLTPCGSRLVAVNTADDRLEVFDTTSGALVALPAIPVGIDPVSVRARTNTEVWVVNHISDSVSVVDLATGRVVTTLDTDDEPADVAFAGNPLRAFVSCSQANSVLVFDPSNLIAPPTRIELDAEDPRALAVSPSGDQVYVAVFESGNGSTVLGGGIDPSGTLGFPPNVVSDPAGPYSGVNPPPNDGAGFEPAQNGVNPSPPPVGLIVRKDAAGKWMDDNGSDWTALVSGANADLSGRPVGWDLPDHDVAVIDANSLSVTWVNRLMNINMALAVHPTDGRITVVGTEATNEVRFEPNLTGTFVRTHLALVDVPGSTSTVLDLNDHLTYTTSTVPQTDRDKSVGDPRGIAWNAAGTRAYVTGMGSNNIVVLDSSGARSGIAPTIEVGEGPTGIVLDHMQQVAYVLNKFEASISTIDLGFETETSRTDFYDPSPLAIRVGRKHLYDTHKNSGLGQTACASCHIDARMDQVAWDLGDPAGEMKGLGSQNLSAGLPLGLVTPFEDFHPMKGPMLTQTMQDIIGKEPHHWRGDRDGLEEFSGAFIGLQGDDTTLSGSEMQEFEDFLATVYFPPNPYRNFDNSLPTALPLDGHFTTGRFAPAGQPLGTGNAVAGMNLYRPPNFIDQQAVACSTCHTLPTGLGTDTVLNLFGGGYQPIAPGPLGERHHALVSVDGTTNVSMKIPQLRNLYERTGFNSTQSSNRSGFGYLHDGSVDSIERFISEPIFDVQSDQEVANLTAFMLAFSGSDLPTGTAGNIFEPPSTLSQDTHAAVGAQTTLVSLGGAPASQLTLLADMKNLADAGAVGLVARGKLGGSTRGWAYAGADIWQSDRAAETLLTAALQASASPGSEITFVVVPNGTQTRIGIDRDEDGHFDTDEIEAASDPADPASTPGACADPLPGAPSALTAVALGADKVELTWVDGATVEVGFVVERRVLPTGSFEVIALLGADVELFTDIGVDCNTAFEYRVCARNCAGVSAAVNAVVLTGDCPTLFADVGAVSLSAASAQTLTMDFGPGFGGEFYGILGSASGSTPGFSLSGIQVPLNPDFYFTLTATSANSAPFVNTFGTLSGAGTGTAMFDLVPGLSPGLAGTVLTHAAIVLDGTFAPLAASNPVTVLLAP